MSGLHYLLLVIKEPLRLQRPAPLLITRECWTPCRVLRFDVPMGVTILVNTWAIGRNSATEFSPERFEDSGAFDLTHPA